MERAATADSGSKVETTGNVTNEARPSDDALMPKFQVREAQ